MDLSLDSLDARGLALRWPHADGEDGQAARVTEVTGLGGRLHSAGGRTQLEDCTAELLVLELLQLVLGTLRVGEDAHARFTSLAVTLDSRPEETRFEVRSATMQADRLVVETPSLRLAAEVHADGFEVASAPEQGTIRAASARFQDFRVELNDLSAHFSELEVQGFFVRWGDGHIRYGGSSLRCPRAVIESSAGVVTLGRIAIDRLDNVDAGWSAEGLSVAEARAEIELSGGTPAPSGPTEAEATALPPAPTLLDGVTGRLAAQVHTVLSVPVIERRAATHEPNLLVEDGRLHFPTLLNGLSRLEESLLSLRLHEGALCLELHPPLLPSLKRTLLRWPLPPEERVLADQELVLLRRLLFGWRRPSDGEGTETEREDERSSGGNGVQLERLVVDELDLEASLRDTGEQPGPVSRLAIDRVHLGGTVRWEEEQPDRPGELTVEASGLVACLWEAPLGAAVVSVEDLVAGLSCQVVLAGYRPRVLRLTLSGVGAASLRAR